MTNEQMVAFPIKFVQALVALLLLAAAVNGIWEVWREELRAKRLYTFVPVTAASHSVDLTAAETVLGLDYSYEYEGVLYRANTLSPFPEANEAAMADEGFREWITRDDAVELVVYINPDNPAESSVLRGWVGADRLRRMTGTGFIGSLAIVFLYMTLRPVRRVAQLFRG